MKVTRILESALYVDDLTLAQDFYGQVLGLELHSQLAGRHLFFHCGDGMLLIFNPETTSRPSGDIPTHGASGPGHVAFAIEGTDLPNWKAHLRQHSIDIETEITWPSGGRSIYFRDPAGNSVELVTPQTWGLSD